MDVPKHLLPFGNHFNNFFITFIYLLYLGGALRLDPILPSVQSPYCSEGHLLTVKGQFELMITLVSYMKNCLNLKKKMLKPECSVFVLSKQLSLH